MVGSGPLRRALRAWRYMLFTFGGDRAWKLKNNLAPGVRGVPKGQCCRRVRWAAR